MDHPIRPGTPVQRFARCNSGLFTKHATPELLASYRAKDGWEDGVYVEKSGPYHIVRVGYCEFVCSPEDVRNMPVSQPIVKAADQTDDKWLVTLATDFRRWGNIQTAERLEKIAGKKAKGRKVVAAKRVRSPPPRVALTYMGEDDEDTAGYLPKIVPLLEDDGE